MELESESDDSIDLDLSSYQSACHHRGHLLNGETVIVYIDGVIVGRCHRCDSRIEIKNLRGGTSALNAKSVALRMGGIPHPGAEAIIELMKALDAVEEDVTELTDVAELLRTTRSMVTARMMTQSMAPGGQ